MAAAQRDTPEVVPVRVRADRDPHTLVVNRVSGEVCVCDTDYRERTAIQVHGSSDDVRRSLELRLPQTMADDGDGIGALELLVVGEKGASSSHWDAEHVEEIGRDVCPWHLHGVVARAESKACQSADVIGRETFEHRLPRAVLEVVRIGKRVETVTTVEPAAFSAVDATDFDETIRFRDPRALPEEICIRQAEDDGVASDADSERQRRGQRKHRSTSEGTRGIAHILEERIDRRSRLDVAYPFFHCLQSAELNGRRTTGVVRPSTSRSRVVRSSSSSSRSTRSRRIRFRQRAARRDASVTGVPQASSARAMASAIRFHWAASSPNCRRPALVSV